MSMQSLRYFFSADHDRVGGLFRNWQEKKKANSPDAYDSFRKFLVSQLQHMDLEEKLIFPLFEQQIGNTNTGLIQELHQDHIEIQRTIDNIHNVLRRAESTEAAEVLLSEMLEAHHEKEEDIFYPILDQWIDEQERNRIFTRIQEVAQNSGAQTCCESGSE